MAKLSRHDWLRICIPGEALPAGYRLRKAGERVGPRDIHLARRCVGSTQELQTVWVAAFARVGKVLTAHSLGFGAVATTSPWRKPTPEAPFRRHTIDEASLPLSRTETNDCAVIALREVTGQSYQDCHAFWELHGRQRRRGTHVNLVFRRTGSHEFPELGFRTTAAMHWNEPQAAQNNAELAAVATRFCGVSSERTPTSYDKYKGETMTLARFLKKYPVGRWFVCSSTHAFAVIDGVVVDNFWKAHLRRRIREAWLITPLSPAVAA